MTITRQDLYELIWTQPRSLISKKLTISDQELVKICKKANIPIPPAGYIQSLRHGKNIPDRPHLSHVYLGDQEIKIDSELGNAKNESYNANPELLHQREIECDKRLKLVVPSKLDSPDMLIARARTNLIERQNSPHWKDMVATKEGLLRISVSKANIDRALRIMDVLVKALKIRGHSFQIESECSYVIIQGQKIELWMAERCKRVKVLEKYGTRYDLELTGKLSFKIRRRYQTREWIDSKILLEGQIVKIIAALEIEGEKLKAYQIKLEEGWERQRIEAEERKKKAELREQEVTSFKLLISDAKRWHQANLIRSYLDCLDANGHTKGMSTAEFADWLSWARRKADWLDPNIERFDEALTEIDRSTSL